MEINSELKKYIEENILPRYEKNDLAHNINHVNYVIERSLMFASTVDDINYDMVYTVAAYHDVGHSIDAKNHEKVSSEILFNDSNLKNYFSDEEISTMADAVYDHRASLEYEPRSIYGKIVSSADRNTSVEVTFKRTYRYNIKHHPEYNLDETIETCRLFIIDKFGKDGYATKKMYFNDDAYEKYLKVISDVVYDKDKFKDEFLKVNDEK